MSNVNKAKAQKMLDKIFKHKENESTHFNPKPTALAVSLASVRRDWNRLTALTVYSDED